MGQRQRNHPIKALSAHCSDHALANRIGLRTRNGRSQYLNAQSPDRIVEVLGEDLVSIVDRVAMASSPSNQFPQLLQSPVGARVRCHIDMGQSTRAVLDDNKHV